MYINHEAYEDLNKLVLKPFAVGKLSDVHINFMNKHDYLGGTAVIDIEPWEEIAEDIFGRKFRIKSIRLPILGKVWSIDAKLAAFTYTNEDESLTKIIEKAIDLHISDLKKAIDLIYDKTLEEDNGNQG
jgi:hypothetical protein